MGRNIGLLFFKAIFLVDSKDLIENIEILFYFWCPLAVIWPSVSLALKKKQLFYSYMIRKGTKVFKKFT